MQEVSCFSVKSILGVCVVEASIFHTTLGLVAYCHKITFGMYCTCFQHRNFASSADECENRILMSNSTHKSFNTVKVKHPSEVRIKLLFHCMVRHDSTLLSPLWIVPGCSLELFLVLPWSRFQAT